MRKNICKNCRYYSAYYKRWACHYGKLSHGMCRRQNLQKTQFEVCDDYIENTEYEQEKEKDLLKHLEKTLYSLDQIALILQEKQQEKKEDI